MAETTSVLTADPQVLAYTLGYERILRALTLQNQLGQLLAQMEERASTLLLPTSPLSAPSTQFSFSPRQIQPNQSEDGGLALGMDDATSSSSEAPMPLLLQHKPGHPEIISRGAVVSTSNRLPLHRQGSQSLSSSGSAQESDNLSEPPTFEQKFRPPPAPSLVSSELPAAPGDHHDTGSGREWGVTAIALVQRWASLPPEVTVKSLPLTTNLKIVTVTSFSLPA
jgi:hypothetical protein